MRFRFIEDLRAACPVRMLCDVPEVSWAGYYAWRSRTDCGAAANRELANDIKRIHRVNC